MVEKVTEFKIKQTAIPGLLEIDISLVEDDRGYFQEKFQKEKLVAAGFPESFVQVQQNISFKSTNPKTRRLDGMPTRAPKGHNKNHSKIIAGERDVPFNWENYKDTTSNKKQRSATLAINDTGITPEAIIEPKRKFALPLHFSLFPLSLWPSKKKRQQPATKKKLRDGHWLTRVS